MHQSTGHQPMEPRTAMAYWQNGKLYLHGSTQSVARTVANIAQWVEIPQEQVVVISEYTGGGFGGKIPGAQTMAIPAMLSKKTGRPVMMRITREEENYIGRARAGIHLRAKIGFRKDGRITGDGSCARLATAVRIRIRVTSGTVGVERDRALQPRNDAFSRHRGAHEHAAARLAARARGRAGSRHARADDQQGRAPPRRRPG